MSVLIEEMQVEPRREEEPRRSRGGGDGGGGGPDLKSPEVANKIAETVALLHARELRLVAD